MLSCLYNYANIDVLACLFQQDAASLSVTILKKRLRGRIFLGCDNHPVSRLFHLTTLCVWVKQLRYSVLLNSVFLTYVVLPCDCRQEVMDLVHKSGKFDKKFEGFTGN